MNSRSTRIQTMVSLLLLSATIPVAARPAQTPAALARLATVNDPKTARLAIASLRALGPSGLQALFDTYAGEINVPTHSNSDHWRRLSAALDEVGQQRDCDASHLYWYTNLDMAKAAARKSGKPILSLRLLGKLNEELSCANSRFFRTALYPNAEVSQYLREHFILHWKSERPAPKITIDFGDGRKIVRTITGNSIHYVLDADGRPIDAIPGLYGPMAFLRELRRDVKWAGQLAATPQIMRPARLRRLHWDRFNEVVGDWQNESKALIAQGIRTPMLPALLASVSARPESQFAPAAQTAAPLAMSKMLVEMPVVSAISGDIGKTFEPASLDTIWVRLGALHAGDARLDANGLAKVARKYPNSASARQLAASFEQSMALDTERNEYLFHAQIHSWFANDAAANDLETLNKRVYGELFLTPRSDPWLGLSAKDAYAALPNGGLSEPANTSIQHMQRISNR